MKKFAKIILSTLCAALVAVPVFLTAAACTQDKLVDYTSQVKLDFSSETKKQEVVVRLFIDGDTTHFDPVNNSKLEGCNNKEEFAETNYVIKARYLAINTPESTGTIEEWGKAASKFTRSKLEPEGTQIVVEADDNYWDIDSTGERYLLWIWYKPPGETEFRNLNLEILQVGLAYGSSLSGLKNYKEVAEKASAQAQAKQLYVYSDEKDPDFYYGGIVDTDLKALRLHTEKYNGVKVRVEGTVVAYIDSSVYIEALDEDSGMYFGISAFLGYQPGKLLTILATGNRVSIVGTLQYYEGGDTWQLSGIPAYNSYNKDDPNNCKIIEEGVAPGFPEKTPAQIMSKTPVTVGWDEVENEEGDIELVPIEMLYGEAIMSTSVSLKNLFVYGGSTTESGDNKGAISLYCRAGDTDIVVRTQVLKDANGELVTLNQFLNKTINVKGIVDKFYGNYQIKVNHLNYLEIVG